MLAWNQNTFVLWFLSDDCYKMWNIIGEDYWTVEIISSDESVDHQFPLELTEPVPQHSVKGLYCISQETKINVTIILRLEESSEGHFGKGGILT